MTRDSLQYDKMVEAALRGVVREALTSVREDGLPGSHHFYLTFSTTYPGVEIAERLHAQYPREMTIVLQHQYWGLEVAEDHFVVNLSFSNIPERLKVPYAALVSFVDPSVEFGLQFQATVDAGPQAATAETKPSNVTAAKDLPTLTRAPAAKDTAAKPTASKDAVNKDAPAKDGAPTPVAEPADADKKGPEKVVSLDAFRKK